MITIDFVLIWIAWILTIGSPGPATLSIASCAMAHGRRTAFWLSLGILIGGAGWGIAAAAGMGALMLTNAWLFEVIRYFGAIYLLYLAYKSFRNAMSEKAITMPSVQDPDVRSLFYRGILINLSNPKAILGWGSVYALLVPASASVWEIAYVFGALYSGSILIFIGYAMLFSNSRFVQIYQASRRNFELGFSLFFGVASLKLLTTKLSS